MQRIGGADGAVSVQYAATAGTATAGQDFTAVSGTLSWGDKDAAAKTFTVPVINDTVVEPTETVLLALSNPAGGATLDATHKSATLNIQDNDPGGGGGTPAAPSNLTGHGGLDERDRPHLDRQLGQRDRLLDRAPGGRHHLRRSSPRSGPTSTHAAVTGLDPASFSLFRVRATGTAANSPYSAEAAAATLAESPGLRRRHQRPLPDRRAFQGRASTGTPRPTPAQGSRCRSRRRPQSGLFYFFDPTNIEMLIKVLNACVPPFNHYWVFFAATTNVEFAVVVDRHPDREDGAYFNPLNRSAPPIQDINAFATCP